MNLKFDKGAKIVIQLCDGKKYDGTYVTNNNRQISITNVSEHPSNFKINKVFHFYSTEIAEIKLLDKSGHTTNTKKEKVNMVVKEETKSNNQTEISKYNEIIDKCVIVCYGQPSFDSALHYLKTQPIMSVMGFGCFLGRHTDIGIFGIGIKDKVILLDFKNERIPVALHDIFLNSNIKKIVFNSKSLADCLNFIFAEKLINFFDVQVADYMLIQKETGEFPEKMNTLTECIKKYIPTSKFDSTETSGPSVWQRPLTYNSRANMTLANYYLYELYFMLTDIILSDVNEMTEKFAKCMVEKSVGASFKYMGDDVPDELKK